MSEPIKWVDLSLDERDELSGQYSKVWEPYLIPLPGCMIRQSTADRLRQFLGEHPTRLNVLLDEALRDYLNNKMPEIENNKDSSDPTTRI